VKLRSFGPYLVSETRVYCDRVIPNDKKLVLPDIRGRVSYRISLAANSCGTQRDNNKNSIKGVILKVDSAFPNGESFNGWEKGKRLRERMKRAASLSYFNARRAYLILMRGMRSLVHDEIDNYPTLYALPLIRAIST